MLPTAQSQLAGERKRSRWDQARLSLVMPLGVIVAVAIVAFGVYPQPVLSAVQTAAQHFLAVGA